MRPFLTAGPGWLVSEHQVADISVGELSLTADGCSLLLIVWSVCKYIFVLCDGHVSFKRMAGVTYHVFFSFFLSFVKYNIFHTIIN